MFSPYSKKGRHKKEIGCKVAGVLQSKKNRRGYSESCDWVKNSDTQTITKCVEAYKQVFRTRVRFPPPPPENKEEEL